MTLAITAGPGPVCICPYIGETWHDAVKTWEYHQEWDPECPAHQGIVDWQDGIKIVYLDTPPWALPKPCTCHYYPFGSGKWWLLGSTFQVNSACPNHGDALREVIL